MSERTKKSSSSLTHFSQFPLMFQNQNLLLLQIPKLEVINFPCFDSFSSVLKRGRKKNIPCSWRGREWILSKLSVNHSWQCCYFQAREPLFEQNAIAVSFQPALQQSETAGFPYCIITVRNNFCSVSEVKQNVKIFEYISLRISSFKLVKARERESYSLA